MENEMDALLAILLLKPLLEYFWVFSNPVEALQWTLPSQHRTQRVLSSSVPICTLPRRPPGSIFSTEHSTVLGSFCAPFAPAQCPPGRALRILSDSGLPSNSQQSSSPTQPVHMLNAHLAELSQNLQQILSATVFLIHSLASKVFSNLEVFLLSC
jgi:hypothetical protein